MSESRWPESGSLKRAVETAVALDAFDAAFAGILDNARAGLADGTCQARSKPDKIENLGFHADEQPRWRGPGSYCDTKPNVTVTPMASMIRSAPPSFSAST